MQAYLDHAATTPVHPEVAEAMLPWLTTRFGNPSGGHAVARAARTAVEDARDELAAALGCMPREIVFTSGGTEADNLAVAGIPGTVACSSMEHKAVFEPVRARGGTVFDLDDGPPDADLVSVVLVNNITGSIQDLAAVRPRVRGLLHTDAVQALPWVDVAGLAAPADLVSVTSHKVGGPQGVGALVVREGVRLEPLLRGGGQERERRSGSLNVAGIVGFAVAVRVHRADVSRHRDRLLDGLLGVPGVRLVHDGPGVPGIVALLVDGVESEELLVLLDREGLCASAGASCASGAIGRSQLLRLSLGWTTTDADIDHALDVIPRAIAQLRSVLP